MFALASGTKISMRALSDRARALMALGCGALLTAGSVPAMAQCDWLPGEAKPGTNGTVHEMTTWDPDGPGPQPELLIAGGTFTYPAVGVAAYDGSTWHALGSGLNGSVSALLVHNGELVVGGYFTEAGGMLCSNIACWDGSAWHALSPEGSGDLPYVGALAVYNGELIAGTGAAYNYIARWDGSAWHSLGSGVSGGMYSTRITALTIYNGDLVAAGSFTVAGGYPRNNVARWNGSQWLPFGSGLAGTLESSVECVTVYGGELVAGGWFDQACGGTCGHIAAWDGSAWHPLGSASLGWVLALTTYNGDLIAGCEYTPGNIARWDGSSWSALGSGVNYHVWALGVYGGLLIAGGESGDRLCGHIYPWDGSAWGPALGPASGTSPSRCSRT